MNMLHYYLKMSTQLPQNDDYECDQNKESGGWVIKRMPMEIEMTVKM